MPQNFQIKTTFKAVDKSTRVIGKIQSRITRMTAKASMGMRKLDKVMSRIGSGLKRGIASGARYAAVGMTALAGSVWAVMREFSKVEDSQAAFTPVLGSIEKARQMVDALNDTAATTPFQFENLSDAAKQLLPNMGGDIQETIKRIRMLGDTAGGSANKMESIVRGYNKALLKGKVDMESLNMIAEAGVPIFGDLGKIVGMTGTKLFKAISKGKVSTEDLTKTFEKMTGEGGIFFKGMEIASKTISGKISTLKDNVGLAAAEFGDALAPALKDSTDKLTEIVKGVRVWIKENKGLIKSKFDIFIKQIPYYYEKIVYWGPKILKGVAVFYALSAAIKVASVAMTLFNAACNINLGPFKALNRSIGAVSGQTAAATGAVGGLQSAFYALGAFAAGWGIGTILYDQLVKPFMEARHQANMLRQEHLHTMSGDLEKKNSAVLEGDLNRVKKIINQEKRALPSSKRTSAFVGGMAAMYGGSSVVESGDATLRRLEADKARITSVYNRKKYDSSAPMSDEWSSGIEAESRWMPSVTTHREVVEVRIKDDSGKAELTKGKHSKTVKMERGRRRPLTPVHTGGMP
jgi:tape measure domain-containing protein